MARSVLSLVQGGDVIEGRVARADERVVYVAMAGYVLAVTASGVPAMPNAVCAAGSIAAPPPLGSAVRLRGGLVETETLAVWWSPSDPPVWRRPAPGGVDRVATARRSARILENLGRTHAPRSPRALARLLTASGLDATGIRAVTGLFESLVSLDPEGSAAAAELLCGRGPGLTPVGDDVLAAVAGTAVALSALLPASPLEAWLRPIRNTAAGGRTTSLSATLLACATLGELVEPAMSVLASSPTDGGRFVRAVDRLLDVGSSTGVAYAVGIAAACRLLPVGVPSGVGHGTARVASHGPKEPLT